jgi:hypothetical protein
MVDYHLIKCHELQTLSNYYFKIEHNLQPDIIQGASLKRAFDSQCI